jgi:hypothetical protein
MWCYVAFVSLFWVGNGIGNMIEEQIEKRGNKWIDYNIHRIIICTKFKCSNNIMINTNGTNVLVIESYMC